MSVFYNIQADPKNIEKEIDLGHSYIIKRVDGIIELYCSGIVYDAFHCIEIDTGLKSLFNGEKLLILNYTTTNTALSSGAREYLANAFRADFIKANAIFIQSLPQRILGHFFLYVNKPAVNTCFFSHNEKKHGTDWLMQFKK